MKLIVTTSWDDGHKLDIKLAKLIDQYSIRGTFYISKEYLGDKRLNEVEILSLASSHEIGAHTITHPNLTNISPEEAIREISESKLWLESVTNNQIEMFCYPYGIFSSDTAKEVEKAGFIGARGAEKFTSKFLDPFTMGTTLNVYPFPFRKLDSDHYHWRQLLQPLIRQYKPARSLGVRYSSFRSWYFLAESVFDIVYDSGGIFHLWGHSWEIEKYGMWGELERLFVHMSKYNDCVYLTNGEVVKFYHNSPL